MEKQTTLQATRPEVTRRGGTCETAALKAVPYSRQYAAEKADGLEERFIADIKHNIETDAKLDCDKESCEHGKCMLGYVIGEIESKVLVKPGGKTQLKGKVINEGLWRFEASVLCTCFCVQPV